VDWYAPIAKHIVHPLWAFKDGETHLSILRQLEKTQYRSADEIAELQMDRLRTILMHAYENSPFYRKRFDDVGFSPSSFSSFEDLLVIPFMTKEDIQNHKEDMVAKTFRGSKDLWPDRTGGSTGKPLHYYRDRTRFYHLKAAAIRHDRWAGYDIGDKQVVIWGNRQDYSRMGEFKARVRNLLHDRLLVLDSSNVTQEKMAEFAERIRRFRPKTVLAYANSGALFARYLLENGIRDLHMDGAITSAEMLNPGDREVLEEAFDCKVFDRYGCREMGLLASECEVHEGMHIDAECVYVEFIRDGRPVASGERGDIVITDLLNFGMPFIRYRIEDVGVPTDRQCSCGRGLPLMEMVAGRTTDFIVCPDGRQVSGVAFVTFVIAQAPGVRQAQIVQEEPGAIRLRLVKGKEFTDESIVFLRDKMPEFFGSGMHVEYEFVDSIPSESSGKYRFSICKVR